MTMRTALHEVRRVDAARARRVMRMNFMTIMAIIVSAACALVPSRASAGTLCGTVRDAQTQMPVARAGVFLRSPQGAYTGLHTTTANDGSFCLSDVPAGTYDIEVKVDDYLVSTTRGVQVNDTVTGIDLPVRAASIRLRVPYPNPARGLVRLAFDLRDGGFTHLTVHDARGRLVQGWQSTMPSGAHEVRWDLRALSGTKIAAGVYHVRLTAGGETREQRLVVGGVR